MISNHIRKLIVLVYAALSGAMPRVCAQELPQFDAPVGIINEYDCCYALCFLQAMEAVRHEIPDLFKEVLIGNTHSLLSGYATTLNDVRYGNPQNKIGFALQKQLLCPDNFMQAVVAASSSRVHGIIVEEKALPDGSIRRTHIGPWRQAARMGEVREIIEAFFEQWNTACKEKHLANPFEILLMSTNGAHKSRCWISLDELYLISHSNGDGMLVVDVSQSNIQVVQYPQFLIVVNSDKKPFVPPAPLQVVGQEEHNTPFFYRPLAIIYALPAFSQDKGFEGNHTIALVRYGSVWYHCNDEMITPFGNHVAARNWIIMGARITYSGHGLLNGLTCIFPHIMIYEKDNA